MIWKFVLLNQKNISFFMVIREIRMKPDEHVLLWDLNIYTHTHTHTHTHIYIYHNYLRFSPWSLTSGLSISETTKTKGRNHRNQRRLGWRAPRHVTIIFIIILNRETFTYMCLLAVQVKKIHKKFYRINFPMSFWVIQDIFVIKATLNPIREKLTAGFGNCHIIPPIIEVIMS